MSEKTKVFNSNNPVAIYDTSDAYQAAINHVIENGSCSDEQKAIHYEGFNALYNEYCQMDWCYMEEVVNDLCGKYFKAGAGLICSNFGWAKRACATEYHDDAFEAFKEAYLEDFSIKVYLKKDKNFGIYLDIVIYHHDSPTGDHFFLVRKKYHAQFSQEHLERKAA